jgi:DNA-binding MarR family transcriptional regulator
VSSDVSQRTPYVGALMFHAWKWTREQLFQGVLAAGYHDLNRAHVALFRYPTLDGLRPIEVAEKMQITKQSVHDLLTYMEGRGYLTREPDQADRRARVVRLTESGTRLELEVRAQAAAAEGRIAAVLGEPRFTQFRDALQDIAREIDAGSLRADMPPAAGS